MHRLARRHRSSVHVVETDPRYSVCTYMLRQFRERTRNERLSSTSFSVSGDSAGAAQFQVHCDTNSSSSFWTGNFVVFYVCLSSDSYVDPLELRYRVAAVDATSGHVWPLHTGHASFEHGRIVAGGQCQLARAMLEQPSKQFVDAAEDLLILRLEFELLDDAAAQTYGLNDSAATSIDLHSLSADHRQLLTSGRQSDFEVVVGKPDEQTKRLSVHRSILTARSTVFADMLDHCGTDDDDDDASLTLSDLSVEVAQELFGFIYTGIVNHLDRLVVPLLLAADKYQIGSLQSVCERYMVNTLTPDSVLDVLQLADQYRFVELEQASIRYVTRHSLAVITTDSWHELPQTRPDLLAVLFEAMAHTCRSLSDPLPNVAHYDSSKTALHNKMRI